MFPLGVLAYPAVVGSTTPLNDAPPSAWKKPRRSRLKRAFSSHRRHSQDPAGATSLSRRSLQLPPPSPSWTHSSSPSVQSASPTRPKHVPIVIPRYASTVAPGSPCESAGLSSSRTSTIISSDQPSLSDFPLPRRKSSFGESPTCRPRHVEIVIPDWILPVQRLSAPHISLPTSFSEFDKPQSPRQHSKTANMATQIPGNSRSNTMDSDISVPSSSQFYQGSFRNESGSYIASVNSSQSSLHRQGPLESDSFERPAVATARSPGAGMAPTPVMMQTAGLGTPGMGNAANGGTVGLSGLVCNVHRTTGREPRPLVGATTTILGDKLYVFGGRRANRARPLLTSDLYELDLVRRHWSKIETKGDIPAPRYFHSVCALGDTKLVCYGGMCAASQPPPQTIPLGQAGSEDNQPEVVVMSDVHIYDIPSRIWTQISTPDAPQGRYAHCATILPSSAAFASADAPFSAIGRNPSSANPNQGSLGVQIDGEGGAEMVVVGGQDSANHYIEQISVFNLRSLKWTATDLLGKSCGSYRSVVAPLPDMHPDDIGQGIQRDSDQSFQQRRQKSREEGASMLIYSNYNFLDVKLDLQVRRPDGTITEKPMNGNFSPPGLRFPNGGVINNHFVVSGTFLTSSKQEYALWALDLRTLTWGRIEAGGNIFTQGSWNRGILWNQRNAFVILGNRKRSLVEDYNHRRINFSNMCIVELEAFGLYDNPRKIAPKSSFQSGSAPMTGDGLDPRAGGRYLNSAATADLGQLALSMRELADMEFLAVNGERIPVNSRLIARRWGPYFNQLLRESTTHENSDTATLRPTAPGHPSRNSSITITPSIKTTYSSATTLTNNSGESSQSPFSPPDLLGQPPHHRPRTLYLPHTHLTLQALIHFLYTSSLPPLTSPLSSPQILCSLLQLARPYHIDGLLEAIIERLHVVLDNRNTAAIFNAAAMAAGGGSAVSFFGVNGATTNGASRPNGFLDPSGAHLNGTNGSSSRTLDHALRALRIDTELDTRGHEDDTASATSTSTAASLSEHGAGSGVGSEREIWTGEMSAVVGLQKRGLRGLMEGRRIREMGRGGPGRPHENGVGGIGGSDAVGLGLMGGPGP